VAQIFNLSQVYGVECIFILSWYCGKSRYFFNFALSQLKRMLKAKRGKSFEFFEKNFKKFLKTP